MLNILFEDDQLLIVSKPSGLLCVPGLSEDRNLFDQVRKYNPNARVIHRLDMATSGIVLFALSHLCQKNLGQQFEQRLVKKQYSALVKGYVSVRYGEIESPMMCDWPNRPRQKIDWLHGRAAHTLFQRVTHQRTVHGDVSLLLLTPLTGRSHQLRLHCLQLGHPILGDNLYNETCKASRLMLHAEKIAFLHPTRKEWVEINSPAPFDINHLG